MAGSAIAVSSAASAIRIFLNPDKFIGSSRCQLRVQPPALRRLGKAFPSVVCFPAFGRRLNVGKAFLNPNYGIFSVDKQALNKGSVERVPGAFEASNEHQVAGPWLTARGQRDGARWLFRKNGWL
jgi:hypothetical protein